MTHVEHVEWKHEPPVSMLDAPGFATDDDPREFTQLYSAKQVSAAKFNSWCWGYVIGVLLGAAVAAIIILSWH